MGDEGRPFEGGNQVLTSSHRKLLSSKAMAVNVAETPGQGKVERGERKRTVDEVSKAGRCQIRGVTLPPGAAWEMS
jgi:hypothetical protein